MIKTPNNILAVEYLKALTKCASSIAPVTVHRTGSGHDAGGPESASHLRRLLREGQAPWHLMPERASRVYREEIACGRGPVFMDALEQAVLSRLRMLPDSAFRRLPDATEGLGDRLARFARAMPTLETVLASVKTKRYALSRLRRMALCAALGIDSSDVSRPPPYIRVLAFGDKGRLLLREIKGRSFVPVITKPAAARSLGEDARRLFRKEADATDLYVLAFPGKENRAGGREWTTSPLFVQEPAGPSGGNI